MNPRSTNRLVGLLTPSFLVAVSLLGAAAVLAGPIASWLRIKQNKEALPLKEPLRALSTEDIAPYQVVDRQVLDPAVVESLGTKRYLSWDLVDTGATPGDPLRKAHLFVTYYSGGNDLVPHTPDVCYRGGGYRAAQPHENVTIEVPQTALERPTVPVRVCTFVKSGVFQHQRLSVVYTFHCNGQLVASRDGVRWLVNTLSNTYAYFSKVEVSFPGATRAQSIAGAQKLLGRVLPVLIRDHWPDFQEAERLARQRTPTGG